MDPYHIRKKKSNEKFMRENPGKWYLRVDAESGELESATYYKKDANPNVPSPGNWLNAAKQFDSKQEAEAFRDNEKFIGYQRFYASQN